jgi:hypothetical protein
MRLNLGKSEQRVKLLKAGFSGKEIEKLYIEQHNFKIVHNILYEAIDFNVHRNINKRKGKTILLFGIVSLFIADLIPFSIIFLTLFLMFLFVPPMFVFYLLLIEGMPIISGEMNKLPNQYNVFPINTSQ